MPSSYSSKLRLELIANGEQVGSWGDTTNRNLGTLLEQAIAGVTSVVMLDANYTLSTINGASDEARSAILIIEGTTTATRDVIIPIVTKIYIVTNLTSGGMSIRVKTASGAEVTVPNGVTAQVYCDGLDTFLVSSNQTTASGTVTSITAQAPLTGGTITGSGTIGLATVATLTPGIYGNSSAIPVINVDSFGRVISASQVSITGGAGSGTVTSVATGSGLTGGPITTTGTISLATTGVTPSTYGSSSLVPVITVDAFGRIIGISTASSSSSSTSISNTGGSVACTSTGITLTSTGIITVNNGGNFSINGSLSAAGTVNFPGSTFIVQASTVTCNSDVRWGSGSQTFRVGGNTAGNNKLLLSTSGSNVRGLLWDGVNVSVGRGIPGGSSNVLAFNGDSTSGTATFTVSGVFKPGGGSFSASSDERLKDIHGPYGNGLQAVIELQPIEFNYKDKPSEKYVGLSAQKVKQTQFSSMVGRREDGYLTVDNSELVYALVNAVKEINVRLKQLENT